MLNISKLKDLLESFDPYKDHLITLNHYGEEKKISLYDLILLIKLLINVEITG